MGMAPTAGRCVALSNTKDPVGVMGRPSPAGSCWLRALSQKHNGRTRKTGMARDVMGPLSQSVRFIVPVMLKAAINLHASGRKENSFAVSHCCAARAFFPCFYGNAFDPKRFYF